MLSASTGKTESVYGARKIKEKLQSEGKQVSRARVVRVMKNLGIASAYTHKKYRRPDEVPNKKEVHNLFERKFNGYRPLFTLISNITYVRVSAKWAYIYLFLDLANREIVGHAASWHRDASLV